MKHIKNKCIHKTKLGTKASNFTGGNKHQVYHFSNVGFFQFLL